MISLVLILLAAACNAVMDVISHHYSSSVFVKLNHQWWNPEVSWKNKYVDYDRDMLFYPNEKPRIVKLIGNINIPVNFSDAWHLFKTMMIVLICTAVCFYSPLFTWYYDLLILGTTWNLTFSLFYNKILVRK